MFAPTHASETCVFLPHVFSDDLQLSMILAIPSVGKLSRFRRGSLSVSNEASDDASKPTSCCVSKLCLERNSKTFRWSFTLSKTLQDHGLQTCYAGRVGKSYAGLTAVVAEATGLSCGECCGHGGQKNAIPQISHAGHTYPTVHQCPTYSS